MLDRLSEHVQCSGVRSGEAGRDARRKSPIARIRFLAPRTNAERFPGNSISIRNADKQSLKQADTPSNIGIPISAFNAKTENAHPAKSNSAEPEKQKTSQKADKGQKKAC